MTDPEDATRPDAVEPRSAAESAEPVSAADKPKPRVCLSVARGPEGGYEIRGSEGQVLATCATHAAAWRWIDRETAEGRADTDRHHRIRFA